MVKTGKGYHCFVMPTGFGNRAGVLPGVDFRGEGGYVVASPSLHPNGHRYQRINSDFGELTSAPGWHST
jgi:Bifunctional DNA primase/polymerase, N-terminal